MKSSSAAIDYLGLLATLLESEKFNFSFDADKREIIELSGSFIISELGKGAREYDPYSLDGFKKIILIVNPSELERDLRIPVSTVQCDRTFVLIPDAERFSKSDPRFSFINFPSQANSAQGFMEEDSVFLKDGSGIKIKSYLDVYKSRIQSFDLAVFQDILGLSGRELFPIANFGKMQLRKYMCLDPKKHIDSVILKNGFFEQELTQFVVNFLDKSKRCIDVGGNIGYFSLLFCELARHVVIFEPMTSFVEILEKNLYYNNYRNYSLLSVGLSDKRDTHEIYQGECSGTLHWIAEHPPSKVELVELYPLDELLLLEAGKYDLIKIDVDGHDFKVLKGAENFITKQRPVVLFEIAMINHSSAKTELTEVFSFFYSKNYTIYREDNLSTPLGSQKAFIDKANIFERSWNFIALP
jgi:FkbM family methyltransferase